MNEINLNLSNFNDEITNTNKLVLIDFFATWCGPCKMLSPIISEIANEYSNSIKVCKVNVDENQELAMEYGIMSIPTIVIIKNGKAEKRYQLPCFYGSYPCNLSQPDKHGVTNRGESRGHHSCRRTEF